MLPLVGCHDVEVLSGIFPVLIILRVCGKEEVVLAALFPAFPSGIVVREGIGADGRNLLTLGIVSTEVSVQAEVFESVDLIVSLQVTYERTGIGSIVLLIECSHGVPGGVAVDGIGPSLIGIGRTCSTLVVAAEPVVSNLLLGHDNAAGTLDGSGVTIVARGVTTHNGLCGVHIQRCAGHARGVTVADIHTLGVEVEGEVLVEERGIQVHRSGHTMHTVGLNDTITHGITQRETVGHILHATGYREVMVCRNSGAVNFILPVGVIEAEPLGLVITVAEGLGVVADVVT